MCPPFLTGESGTSGRSERDNRGENANGASSVERALPREKIFAQAVWRKLPRRQMAVYPLRTMEDASQRVTLNGPLTETTLKLVFRIVSRIAFSPVRLSSEITSTAPLFTSTVARTTPGSAISLFFSLRPQPGHSQPLIRTSHWSRPCLRGFADALNELRHTVAASPPITNCRRSIFHLMSSAAYTALRSGSHSA